MCSLSFFPVSEDCFKIIDQRFLRMEIKYCHVSREIARKAELLFYEFVNRFSQNSFIIDWLLSGKPTKNIPEIISSAINLPDLIVQMNIRTSKMRTRTDLRKTYRNRLYDLSLPIMHWSADFDAYYSKTVEPYLSSHVEFKQALLRLFHEPGKKNLMNNLGHDADGLFNFFPNRFGSNMGHGTINFTVHAGCISGQIPLAANLFWEEVKELCQLLNNAKGTVELTPLSITSAYTKYFIDNSSLSCDLVQKLPPVPDDCYLRNWYEFCYLNNYAWATVISPITQALLTQDNKLMESNASLSIEHLSNSSLCVSLRKPIDQVDVADLAIVKKLLYPAMYPGKRDFTINCDPIHRPRSYWELLPIDEDEITIQGGKVIYHHRACSV